MKASGDEETLSPSLFLWRALSLLLIFGHECKYRSSRKRCFRQLHLAAVLWPPQPSLNQCRKLLLGEIEKRELSAPKI
jgi:hypothetical protein